MNRTLIKYAKVVIVSGLALVHPAMSSVPKNISALPIEDQKVEFDRYDLAAKNSHYYSLWCGEGDNDVDGYGFQYNYLSNKHIPIAVKLTGGGDWALRFYYEKDISIEKGTNAIVFSGVGKLSSNLTKLTLDNGTVKKCHHNLDEEALEKR